MDCTNAYRLLIAGTKAWIGQAEVERAESDPAAALELALAAALELGAVLELALDRASSSSATAHPRSPFFLTERRFFLFVIPSIAGGRFVGLDLSTQVCFSGILSVSSSSRSARPESSAASRSNSFSSLAARCSHAFVWFCRASVLHVCASNRLDFHLGQRVLQLTFAALHVTNA